jgi:hypothetical protein
MDDAQDDVIEMCDPKSGTWSIVPKKAAVRIDASTWELAVPEVDERQRFRVNGASCSWHPKRSEPKVLLRIG